MPAGVEPGRQEGSEGKERQGSESTKGGNKMLGRTESRSSEKVIYLAPLAVIRRSHFLRFSHSPFTALRPSQGVVREGEEVCAEGAAQPGMSTHADACIKFQ